MDVNTLVFNVVSHLEVGESLVVVGNVAELGGWNADVGAKMTWTEGDVWTAEVSIPTDSAAIEFKMVRFNEGSGVTTWQEGDNYRAEMGSGQTVRVDAPNAFVQSVEVRIVTDGIPAESKPKTLEVPPPTTPTRRNPRRNPRRRSRTSSSTCRTRRRCRSSRR